MFPINSQELAACDFIVMLSCVCLLIESLKSP
jgi:hypothetical protein